MAETLDLLLATGNPGKLRELRQLTARLPWRWRTLAEFPAIPEAREDQPTFAANAAAKALHYAAASGLPTLADDSGLEVQALNGRPGVHSARFAGQPRSDAANNRKLIESLRGVRSEKRAARFVCAMAFVRAGRVLAQAEGAVEGRIIDEPRGENGFGYDPHFLIADRGRTMAELPPDEKNAISHRGRALRAILPQIERILVSASKPPA